jgi:hypothetical protein
MTSPTASESAHRFRDILSLVSREPIRTAYEVAARLQLPISSTYLAVAELERLSCLARDESGYLLLGMLPQQAALNALGYEISAQRLPPLVRYLRDQTGETVFTADLRGSRLAVGCIAYGFNASALLVSPFQAYVLGSQFEGLTPGVSGVRLLAELPQGEVRTVAHFLYVQLLSSVPVPEVGGLLVVGVARTSADFPNKELVQRKLIETLSNFNKGNSESRILGAH